MLIGDSHLARMRRSLALIDREVTNAAVGGSTVLDLVSQLDGLQAERHSGVLLSIGTNDAAPWRGISLELFAETLSGVLGRLDGAAVTYLAPPGVVEARLPADAPWTNAAVDEYRAAAIAVCRLRDVRVIRADRLLQARGAKAFSRDGVHLSGAGYRALLPSIKAVTAH